jgi:hypothetical protein
MPPSPVSACPAGYATPPAVGCAYTWDGVHAHPPVSAGTCMRTAEPAGWNTKQRKSVKKETGLYHFRVNFLVE